MIWIGLNLQISWTIICPIRLFQNNNILIHTINSRNDSQCPCQLDRLICKVSALFLKRPFVWLPEPLATVDLREALPVGPVFVGIALTGTPFELIWLTWTLSRMRDWLTVGRGSSFTLSRLTDWLALATSLFALFLLKRFSIDRKCETNNKSFRLTKMIENLH